MGQQIFHGNQAGSPGMGVAQTGFFQQVADDGVASGHGQRFGAYLIKHGGGAFKGLNLFLE